MRIGPDDGPDQMSRDLLLDVSRQRDKRADLLPGEAGSAEESSTVADEELGFGE